MDLILTDGRLAGAESSVVDIAISGGRIAAIEPSGTLCKVGAGHTVALGGGLVSPGFVEAHIHLDKSCIADRCALHEGTLQEAIQETRRVKLHFTELDIVARGSRTLEKAILAGTQYVRTHVEVDPRIGLKGFTAVRQLAEIYAWAVDIEICVFPQEGLLNDPGAEDLLVKACELGADVIGGCPYADTQPIEQIARIFSLARRFDLDVDFHLDFDLDPSWTHLEEVCRQTVTYGWQNRVVVGHVTKLSAMTTQRLHVFADRLVRSGVAVVVLPATDLYLMGRGHDCNVPRGVARADLLSRYGVACALATNNVLNAFTPYGDCSLCRMSNLYANIAQIGRREDLIRCMDMITTMAARVLNLPDYGLRVGGRADLIVLPCEDAASAVAEIVQPVLGVKGGRVSFERPSPRLLRP